MIKHPILQQLDAHNITLPVPNSPIANYVPSLRTGNLLYISGQLPFAQGQILHPGQIGTSLGVEEGQAAARLCAIHTLAQIEKAVAGEWDKLVRLVKIVVFVNAATSFTQHPLIANGASDLFATILGEKGRHARSAVGVSSLPLDAAVEIESIVELVP
jgi:enamine deaminase RidA (YjgF/YER057c/UK114 family)